MEDIGVFFNRVTENVWSDSLFQWLFYISILLLLILLKRRSAVMAFSIYPIAVLLFIYNPLSYQIMRIIFKDELLAYYSRLYEMIPVVFSLSLALTILLFKARKTLRIVLFPVVITMIILMGIDGYAYGMPWLKLAQNYMKVPNEAIEICSLLHRDEGVTIAVPDSLSSYIRQIDASFYMPYARNVNNLGKSLSSTVEDPKEVMQEAGKQACDYFVVYYDENTEAAFREEGWEPEARINEYLVYSVQDVPRIKNRYNNRRQLIQKISLDINGVPENNKNGYTTTVYEYDKAGNIVLEYYLNENDAVVTVPIGYAKIRRAYYFFSRKVSSVIYVDDEDNPVCVYGRYETRYKYNHMKKVEFELYYDQNGQPMNRTDVLYSSKKIIYDKSGEKMGEYYFDIEGKPTLSSDGYAGYEKRKSQEGEDYIVYFDVNGKEI